MILITIFIPPSFIQIMKTILASFILLFIATTLPAQNLYIYAIGGYHLPALEQTIAISDNMPGVRNQKGSWGKGFMAGLAGGYSINKHIAAEISLSRLFSTEDVFDGDNPNTSGTIDAAMNRIIASIKLKAGNKFSPYASFGFVAGIHPSFASDQITVFSKTESLESHTEYKGGTSFGFSSAAGAQYFISENLFVFLEANVILQSWGPEKVEYTHKGSGRFTIYSGSGTIDFTDEDTSNNPSEALTDYFPFNSAGLNAGIAYVFGAKEKQSVTQ
jgi:hypothetical protein